MIELNKIHHLDNREGLALLSEKCAALIIADPPYFEVKGDFDFVWSSFEEYLSFMEGQAKLYKRVLAENGTLFVYGHAKRIAYVQVIFDRYFNLENCITWVKKDSMQYQYYSVETARIFTPNNERLLMYSSNENQFGKAIKSARIAAGLSTIQVAERGKFYGKINHGGSVANWENGESIPSREQWDTLKEIIPLNFEYEQYERMKRAFNNAGKLSDCMEFSQEAHITKQYDHDTKKPEKMTAALILTCSRPGDLVVVPFSGSGTECAMAAKEGRQFVGFETTLKHVEMSNNRVHEATRQGALFSC